ncbi:MAG TPA: GAF domain-containing protein [Hyphomonadaceae bacterium]|nr:GAF domain-containing protein [Hyphomonadaceae bacterium]
MSEQDPDALYSAILDAAMQVTGSDAAGIQIFDPVRNGLQLVHWRNLHPQSAEFWRWIGADSETGCGQALRSEERIVVTDLGAGLSSTDGNTLEYQRCGLRALQCTPLRSRAGRLVGMLSTHWREPLAHADMDFALVDVLARLAADVIERAGFELALRHGEARNAFLLRLGDALRPLSSALEIQDRAASLLGEHLDVERCYYFETDAREERYVVHSDHVRGSAPSVSGTYRMSDWPLIGRALDSGRPLNISDVATTSFATPSECAALAALGVVATVAVTLVKENRFVAGLAVSDPTPRDWTAAEVDLIGEVAERTWSAVERARAEQHRNLLLAELQHRVRNILATVRSIIQRSARSSNTVEDLSMHLEGRLDSLARTQVILTRAPGAGVDLEDIVREELLSQAARDSTVSIDGPEVRLPPKAAEVLNLVVHELVTNSIKYGALSAREGRVAVAWTLNGAGSQHWLRFAWIESGVRVAAAAPRREGFGAELITQRIPYELGGRGAFELKPGGIHCVIEFPLVDGASILETGLQDPAPGRERIS